MGKERKGVGVLEFPYLLYGIDKLTCDIQHTWKESLGIGVYTHFGSNSWAGVMSEAIHDPFGLWWHDKIKNTYTFSAFLGVCCASCYCVCDRFVFIR